MCQIGEGINLGNTTVFSGCESLLESAQGAGGRWAAIE